MAMPTGYSAYQNNKIMTEEMLFTDIIIKTKYNL